MRRTQSVDSNSVVFIDGSGEKSIGSLVMLNCLAMTISIQVFETRVSDTDLLALNLNYIRSKSDFLYCNTDPIYRLRSPNCHWMYWYNDDVGVCANITYNKMKLNPLKWNISQFITRENSKNTMSSSTHKSPQSLGLSIGTDYLLSYGGGGQVRDRANFYPAVF